MRYLRIAITFAYILVDIFFISAAFFPAYIHYYGTFPTDYRLHMLVYAFWMASTVLLFLTSQLYYTVRELTIWRETRRVIRALLATTLFAISLLFLLKIQTFSRSVFIINFVAALVSLVSWRVIKRFFVRYLIAKGFNNVNVLIIGAGRAGRRLAEVLARKRELGHKVIGFLDDHIAKDTEMKGTRVLGPVAEFENIARRHFIDQVFITIPSERNLVAGVSCLAKLNGISIQIVPDDYGLEVNNIRLHDAGGVPLLEYHSPSLNYSMIVTKRLMDIAIASAALVILSPVFLALAILIRLDSKGPIFYGSKRWGQKGRLFKCYKFRSMVSDADSLRSELRAAAQIHGPGFKMKDDPRITRAGKLLRKYSLDELPQLWNVLRGDMSLVGPRPLPEDEEVGQFKLKYLRRLSIKPGLTCLWQIRGRSDIPFERWMKLDEYYIRHWSPAMDVGILLKTVPAVFKGKGAY
ncbi:MAG: polyprenyl glycosylphosphotransferase [Candidatus Omnitrophica bacterium CG11_big_fil_rev_8_21_14_0_20_45_26]|uniref:Polyprenyl glycosylphosphotransferase n=1 Tax=Candidatus Abzuiibacterium crystallinum TaxID=1974748 RepID=A0A2H0LLJ7_9BACT|nr:MAG: polyprenyl glycosylphosphotransferase [Candidatus Omnitrophica bacterium CG11_big_fil_rev_8_21_14_0_20_45_26]PIW64520.1 MAG: sugar transferase [Candidatus Omnitrophica bacterium CG12_big_fil_rev_8_21_14_0_65_45_16]